MNRISRHQAFMGCAEVWAQRSTCMRRAVGAVIVYEGTIISHGYNGAASGEPHCLGKNCVPPGEPGCTRAIHAEVNAIGRIPFDMFHFDGKILYTTESPCIACAARICQSHISAVYYLNEYRVKAGIDALVQKGIETFRMTPSGYVIDYMTGELVE